MEIEMKRMVMFFLLGSLFFEPSSYAKVDPGEVQDVLKQFGKEHPKLNKMINGFLSRFDRLLKLEKQSDSPIVKDLPSIDPSTQPVVETGVDEPSKDPQVANAQDTSGSDKPLQSASELDTPPQIPAEVVADFENKVKNYNYQKDLHGYLQKINHDEGFLIENLTDFDVEVSIKTRTVEELDEIRDNEKVKKVTSEQVEFIDIPAHYIHVYENDIKRRISKVKIVNNDDLFLNPKWTLDGKIELQIDTAQDQFFLYQKYPFKFDARTKLFSIEDIVAEQKKVDEINERIKKENEQIRKDNPGLSEADLKKKFKPSKSNFKKSYNANYEKFIKDFKSEGLDFVKAQEHLQELYDKNNFSEILKRNPNILQEEPKIPLITHHIWLTNPAKPSDMFDRYVKWMENTAKFNKTKDGWKHFLWIQSKDLLPEFVERISQNPDITIMEIDENFKQEMTNRTEYEDALSRLKFGMSSDILRLEILKKYGGIYLDTDYEAFQSFKGINTMYNFYAGLEPVSNYICNAIIGASPNHPVILKMIELIKKNYNQETRAGYMIKKDPKTKEPLRDPNNPTRLLEDGGTTIYVTGPYVITLATTLAAGQEGMTDIIFPSPIVYPIVKGLVGPQSFDDILKEYGSARPQSFGVHYWEGSWVTGDVAAAKAKPVNTPKQTAPAA